MASQNNRYVLVTGGAGYIGSHVAVELLQKNYSVVIVDDLSNSKYEAVKRIESITSKNVDFIKADIRNMYQLRQAFSKHPIWAVVHLAAYKSPEESLRDPTKYYDNNVAGLIGLIECMKEFGVKKFVFSSSATVYGIPSSMRKLVEEDPVSPINPYGWTKLIGEYIVRDHALSSILQSISLRYFNPIGSHPSGLLGEDPNGVPQNLVPYIVQVMTSKKPTLKVYGNDYDTIDGTGVRDYIHVVDLAKGHVAALLKLEEYSEDEGFWKVYNMGTGRGYSVLEVINTVENITGSKVPYVVTDRRLGDVAVAVANPSLAEKDLNWKAEIDLSQMVKDLWKWVELNPAGYSNSLPEVSVFSSKIFEIIFTGMALFAGLLVYISKKSLHLK